MDPMDKQKNSQSGFAHLFLIVLVVLVVGVVGFAFLKVLEKRAPGNKLSNIVGKVTGSDGQKDPWGEDCHIKEQGFRQLSVSPIKIEDIQQISPMGAMIGGHVTPIDHMYFYPNPVAGNRFSAEVYAMADGVITGIQHRGNIKDGPADARPGTDEYRLTIEQTCNQGYYYDLITKLAPNVRDKIKNQDYASVDLPIKAGDLIGYVGNQSLDFGVYDTKVTLNFIVPEHYSGAEPWKIHTAEAFKYFEPQMLASLKPKMLRVVEPLSGKIDYDKDGYLSGNWFKKDTNGYAGVGNDHMNYFRGHLSFAYNDIDPTGINISIGSLVGSSGGQGGQYSVKGNSPDPTDVNQASGLVKYELTQGTFVNANGENWDRMSPAVGVTNRSNGSVQGTLLVQLMSQRELKMEYFEGKSASQVSGFTGSAMTYER